MHVKNLPNLFLKLQSISCIDASEIVNTPDGFWMICKSISDILAEEGIFDFPDCANGRLPCNRFFDDWFIYAVPNESDYVYSLVKLREQESDAVAGSPADGDTPGVTISFVSFDAKILTNCLAEPTDVNRMLLDSEINRVVVRRSQRHHNALKKYFMSPYAKAAYLIACVYTDRIASFAQDGSLSVPQAYKEIVQRSVSCKNAAKHGRLPRFIDSLNLTAGRIVCDHENIYIANKTAPDSYESAAILATHTGNTSIYSFAAEVEFHAKFLTPLAKIKIPFLSRSVYDSALRADMTVADAEFQQPAPFYRSSSGIVKRQYALHREKQEVDKCRLFV